MSETPNHNYNVPAQGDADWHTPLNENFEAFEVDIEIRDAGDPGPSGNDYDPADGGKYLDTETGIVYEGDGNEWTPSLVLGQYEAVTDGPDEVAFGLGDSTVQIRESNTVENDGGDVLAGPGANVFGPFAQVSDGVLGAVIGGGGFHSDTGEGILEEPNRVETHFGTVGGGYGNVAGVQPDLSDAAPTVGGGSVNSATSRNATVAGGNSNSASAEFAAVGGGNENGALGQESTVSGGDSNEATNPRATVGGGYNNTAQGFRSTVSGGHTNDAQGNDATIGGGHDNTAGQNSTVGGGYNNTALGTYATVAGGGDVDEANGNTASGEKSAIGGGGGNLAEGTNATVGGGESNEATGQQSTIGGGSNNDATEQYSTVAGGNRNFATATSATVAGGSDNDGTGPRTFVGGGTNNEASDTDAVVAGGLNNLASGSKAAIPGGIDNVAAGNRSLAAGDAAFAEQASSFVWNDGTAHHTVDGDDGFSSGESIGTGDPTGGSTFNVSATGGVRFVTGTNTVAYLSADDATWETTSTRAVKTNVSPVDPQAMLDGVESLEVSQWEYTGSEGEGTGKTHVGPMAEDFHENFEVGTDEDAETINSVDRNGVALAAIQALSARLDEKDERIAELQSAVERVDELAAENEELRERLASLEEQVEASD